MASKNVSYLYALLGTLRQFFWWHIVYWEGYGRPIYDIPHERMQPKVTRIE